MEAGIQPASIHRLTVIITSIHPLSLGYSPFPSAVVAKVVAEGPRYIIIDGFFYWSVNVSYRALRAANTVFICAKCASVSGCVTPGWYALNQGFDGLLVLIPCRLPLTGQLRRFLEIATVINKRRRPHLSKFMSIKNVV